jgi:menaquinone-9 beta-reductase
VTRCDAVVVGAGPAGSTCARLLRRAGWDVVVVDKASFPRDKVCAGWLTPGAFGLLELAPAEYRAAGFTLEAITRFRTSVTGRPAVETIYDEVVSYAVRRCEFDHFLLQRARARVVENFPARTFRRREDEWIVNESVAAPVVIGAGGHFCPVARYLRGGADAGQPVVAPDRHQPVVAKEAEFRLPAADAAAMTERSPELFFCRDLRGYAWCVRKGEYLNVGIGRRDPSGFADHVRAFIDMLVARGTLAADCDLSWRGHAYFAAGVGARPIVGDGMLLIGDAAGLAYPESGEGIAPAIESGVLAARTLIEARGSYRMASLAGYSHALLRQHPPVSESALQSTAAYAAAARALLRSRMFTRRVLLDRWFLRRDRSTPPLSAAAGLT